MLFNPKDVAECLELSEDARKQQIKRMSEKQVVKIKNSDISKGTNCTFRKLHNTGENFLTESGVYKMIFASRCEAAERFQDWVTDEVLPTIRKTAGYIPTTIEMTDEEIMARALGIAQRTIENKNKEIEFKNKIIEEQKPFVAIAKERIVKGECVSLTDVTKGLNLKKGQISVWAKNNGLLSKAGTEVNKKGEEYFKIYVDKKGFKCIGIKEKGIDLINNNLEDIKIHLAE